MRRLRWLLPVGAFMGPFGGGAIFPLIPTFQREFGLTVAQANSLITVYMVPFAGLMLISGALAQALGERRVAETGFLLYGLGALAVAVAPDYGYLLAARAVQGSGSAFITPVLLGAIGHSFGPELRGRVMGLFSVFIAVGNVLGPLLGGWFEQLYDWRNFFLMLAGVAALFGALYFFLIENRGGFGGIDDTGRNLRRVFTTRSLILLSLSGAAAFFAVIGAVTFTSDFLAGPPLGLGEGTIGTIVSVGFGVGVVAGPSAGLLADRVGRRRTAALGFSVMAAGGLSLLYASVEIGVYRFLLGLILMGFGGHTVFTAFNTLSVELVPWARDTAASVYNSLRFAGYGLAPALLAPVYPAGLGPVLIAVMSSVGLGLLLLAMVREPGREHRT